jgi:hypothetical protein
MVGNPVVDPSCSGNITFNVSVQATQSGAGQPTGTFYFQSLDGPYPSGYALVPSGAAVNPSASASFTLPLGGVAGPATVHVRIMFVPYIARVYDPQHVLFYLPSGFRSSQVAYAITIPGGSSCPTVSLTPPASQVATYIQAWRPLVDLACSGSDVTFSAQAFTVPVSMPPSGTFFFECDGTECPPEFLTPGFYNPHAVSTASLTLLVDEFASGLDNYDTTFIPDDPNQLPMRVSYFPAIQQSSSCPQGVPTVTNGPPPTPTPTP